MPGVALLNYKGGVGKSTLTRELAASLARQYRQRSLVIDMDPQANVSRRLGFRPAPGTAPPTLAAAIKEDRAGCAAEILTPCGWDDPLAQYIDLLPSSFDLENRISEAGVVGAVMRLRKVMTGLGGHHWRFYDCAPSLGHLTQMALVAAGGEQQCGVVLVAEPEYDGVEGVVKAHEFVLGYREVLGVPHMKVYGIVINKNRDTDLHKSYIAEMQDRFGDLVWGPILPLRATLADAQSSAVPLHSMPGGKKTDEMTGWFDQLTNHLVKAAA